MNDNASTPVIPILWRGEHFVAVDKPAGLLSVPSRLGAQDPRPCLGTLLQSSLGMRLWPVHRLDFEVSGVMLFALDAAAHKLSNAWFEQRLVQKTYLALSEGPAPSLTASDAPQIWESRLVRGKKRSFEAVHGQAARTLATWLKTMPDHSVAPGAQLWQLQPETGRPHQLRYELAKRGSPIIGDRLYGAQRPWCESGIALRAVMLRFSSVTGPRLGIPDQLLATELPWQQT